MLYKTNVLKYAIGYILDFNSMFLTFIILCPLPFIFKSIEKYNYIFSDYNNISE